MREERHGGTEARRHGGGASGFLRFGAKGVLRAETAFLTAWRGFWGDSSGLDSRRWGEVGRAEKETLRVRRR